MAREVDGRWRPLTSAALATFWTLALGLCLQQLDLPNDQYGRISPGWQILTFGELPFRDFFDPGYFLTEFSSAAVQWLFGVNLLGEVILNSVFIATGCLLVCLLAWRLTGRLRPSLAAGALALLAFPRPYDYDKVLFYPLGLWLAWRWFDQPGRTRLMALSLGLVVAGLYRYDNGVFVGLAVLTGVVALCWRDRRRFVPLAGSLVFATACLSAPVLLFLETHGGIANAFDQALTYGVREGERTRIMSLPRVQLAGPVGRVLPYPPSENHIRVRWAPEVTSTGQRQQSATRLGLRDEQPGGLPDPRTWRYTLPDASTESIRRLVNDPLVEDTDGINRGTLVLLHPESRILRIERLSPVLRLRLLPEMRTFENAQAVLYYVFILLPVGGAAVLVAFWPKEPAARRAQLIAVIGLCVLLDVFILRDPVNARVGGMAGPFAVLAVWLAGAITRASTRAAVSLRAQSVARLAVAGVALVSLWSLGATMGWSRQLFVPFAHPRALTARLATLAETPPGVALLPSGRLRGVIDYVRDCTAPTDRIYTSWFTPELFYFAQRGFGGATAVSFGGHWSEPRFQRRSITAFEVHPTPIVILQNGTYDTFRAKYRLLDKYFAEHYRLAGLTDFNDPDAGREGYRVLVRVDRAPTRVDGKFGLPCFAGSPHSL